MQLLANLKISTKVISLILMLGAVTMVISFTGSRSLMSVDSEYSELSDHELPATTQLAGASRHAADMIYAGYRALAYDGASREAHQALTAEQSAYTDGTSQLANAARLHPAAAETISGLRRQFDQIHALTSNGVRLGIANRNDEARQILAQADPLIERLSDELARHNTRYIQSAQGASDELSVRSNSRSWLMIILGAIGVAIGTASSLFVSRVGITGPLSRLNETMTALASGNSRIEVPGKDRGDEVGAMAKAVLVFRDAAQAQERAAADKARAEAEQKLVVDSVSEGLSALAKGDLTAGIAHDFPPEYGIVKTNFNDALASLRELIGKVATSAAEIRTGSGEIAQASEDLAKRTESNAASLEETSAALVQIDTRLKTRAEAASATVARADQAIATVSGGRAIADEAVQAMGRVSESAKGIDSVIEGLDKIAFQTRVLAMNAAVEAGRAGDAGRGFAVVADLVSALAMRAEEEAKRARDQLTVTQTDIVTAVDAVQKVDGALADISGDVGEVHQLLGDMASDNQAQSAAITQITTAVTSMDQATQQNAAMVEETSAAARNLSSEVDELTSHAAAFSTGQEREAARPTTRPRTRWDPSRATTKPAAKPAVYRSPVKALAAIGDGASGTAQSDWQDF